MRFFTIFVKGKRKTKIMAIKQDKKNYREHPDENKALIKKSVDELGAGRSILIDSEDTIIAGNGVFEQWDKRPIMTAQIANQIYLQWLTKENS